MLLYYVVDADNQHLMSEISHWRVHKRKPTRETYKKNSQTSMNSHQNQPFAWPCTHTNVPSRSGSRCCSHWCWCHKAKWWVHVHLCSCSSFTFPLRWTYSTTEWRHCAIRQTLMASRLQLNFLQTFSQLDKKYGIRFTIHLHQKTRHITK